MRKYRGHRLLTIARDIVLYGCASIDDKHLVPLGSLPTWLKLNHLNKKISNHITITNRGAFIHGNKEYYYSNIVNEKFSTPDELIQFMEDYFLGQELQPKYKVKDFQFLRVNPYVIWGKKPAAKRPMPKKRVIREIIKNEDE